jgi:hypothetical protein
MSTKQRAFEAFEEHGPDTYSAAEWADRLDTSKEYVYQLRGDYKSEHGADAGEADEADDGADAGEDGPDETEEMADTEESHSGPQSGDEGNADTTPTEPPESSPSPRSESPKDSPEPRPETETESPAKTDGGSAVAVEHEGTEKLSPDGFNDESTSSVPAPDGVELPESVTPDDFEPSEHQGERTEPEPDPDPEPEPEPDAGQGDESGGLLDRIRGDSESKSPEDVVDEAPDEAERDRREDLLGKLENSTEPGADETTDETAEDGPDPTTMGGGMVIDESLVQSMFGMPFSQAAKATGWDGWELTKEEKQANAELLVAYCDEQNIDLSTGGMLAMSLLSTVGGRLAGYKRYRDRQAEPDQGDDAEHVEAGADQGDADRADQGDADEGRRRDPGADRADQGDGAIGDPTETDTPERGETGGFDFEDSSTW